MTPLEWPSGQKLLDCLAPIGSDPFQLSPKVLKPILAKHRADIDSMEACLGETLDEDLGEHLPGIVGDESDLLGPDPNVTGKLLMLLGDTAPPGVKGETPEEVTRLVRTLRETRTAQWKSLRSANAHFAGKVTTLLQSVLSRIIWYLVGERRVHPELDVSGCSLRVEMDHDQTQAQPFPKETSLSCQTLGRSESQGAGQRCRGGHTGFRSGPRNLDRPISIICARLGDSVARLGRLRGSGIGALTTQQRVGKQRLWD
ncbi:MAG: hypothetical protein OES26_07125 [Gammaproteobacteria bacterium]|nr:hypothetical protein [Gammaproteobacteria bacterium]